MFGVNGHIASGLMLGRFLQLSLISLQQQFVTKIDVKKISIHNVS